MPIKLIRISSRDYLVRVDETLAVTPPPWPETVPPAICAVHTVLGTFLGATAEVHTLTWKTALSLPTAVLGLFYMPCSVHFLAPAQGYVGQIIRGTREGGCPPNPYQDLPLP